MSKDVLKGKTFLKPPGHFIDEATEQVEEVKRRHSIVSLFEGYGVKLAKTSHNGSYTGLCPWHDDHNPSLAVDETKGLFHCFGCEAKGDIIELVRKMEGVSFREALKKLEGGSVALPRAAAADKPKKQKPPAQVKTPLPATHTEDLIDEDTPPKEEGASALALITLNDVAEYYHKRLYEVNDAVKYLESRGVVKSELYERYRIGFSDGSLLSKLSDKQKETLKASGILTKHSAEHFHNCIVFPILDPSTSSGQVTDRVVGMYGRRITDDTSTSSAQPPRHLYLPGPHRGVWNRKASKVYDEVVLVESIIDALSLVQIGVENVQPLYGTNGFTAEHLQILKDDNVKTVVLAFDNDEAGRKAAEKHKAILIGEGFAVKTIFPGTHGRVACGACDQPKLSNPSTSLRIKDWNEELLAGLDKETFKLLVEEAGAEQGEKPKKEFDVRRDKQFYWFEFPRTHGRAANGESDQPGITYRVVKAKDMFVNSLRLTIMAKCGDEPFYDSLDVYSARSREMYSAKAAHNLAQEPKRIERDLIDMLEYFESERERGGVEKRDMTVVLPHEDEEMGIAFLKSPDIIDAIASDMGRLGYVSERTNKIVVYLAGISRLMERPLNVYLQAGASGGKSALLDVLESLTPPADVWKASTISSQAFHYVEEEMFMDKIFMMGEAIHDESIEGLVRQMQSEGEISRLVTVKDEKTGEMKATLIKKKVKMSFMVSSTALSLNPENASRCIVLYSDESKVQTERVQERLGYTHSYEWKIAEREESKRIVRKHHAAQTLISKVNVYNPFWKHIRFPSNRATMRRMYEQFLTLIDCVCFLRQMQKPRVSLPGMGNVPGIEVDLDDYETARSLFVDGVLVKSGSDVPEGTRLLYEEIRAMLAKAAAKEGVRTCEISFIQKQVREVTGLGSEFVKKHIRLLVGYEYLAVTGGSRHGTRFAYKLREDKSIEELDISMIPTREQIQSILEQEQSK
jgi:DNA primase catalytic core